MWHRGLQGTDRYLWSRGINGRGCVRFAGSAWLTNLTELVDYSAHTLFVVSRRESTIAMDTVGSGGTGSGHILYMYLAFGNGLRTHYWGKGVVADLPEMTNDLIYAQRLGGGNAHIWESGLLFFSGTSGTSAAVKKGFVLGSRQAATSEPRLRGLVGEVLLYNRALTDAEVKQVHTWLLDRWGALPDSFATTAPVTNGLMVNVSASAGIMRDASGKVQLWADLSGHANHLIQGTASYRPVPVDGERHRKGPFLGRGTVDFRSLGVELQQPYRAGGCPDGGVRFRTGHFRQRGDDPGRPDVDHDGVAEHAGGFVQRDVLGGCGPRQPAGSAGEDCGRGRVPGDCGGPAKRFGVRDVPERHSLGRQNRQWVPFAVGEGFRDWVAVESARYR